MTGNKGITGIAQLAHAVGHMIQNSAFGIQATGTGTRIATFFIYAGLTRGTIGINGTLRSAVGWSANIAGQTGAAGCIILITALGIRTTGTWQTRILIDLNIFAGRRS